MIDDGGLWKVVNEEKMEMLGGIVDEGHRDRLFGSEAGAGAHNQRRATRAPIPKTSRVPNRSTEERLFTGDSRDSSCLKHCGAVGRFVVMSFSWCSRCLTGL